MILGTFCGSTTFDSYIYGPMDGGSLVFEFTTDSSSVYSGFQVRYESVGASFALLHAVLVIFVLGGRRYQAIDWYAGGLLMRQRSAGVPMACTYLSE